MRACRGVDGAEFVAQRLARDFRQRAGQLDAGRTAADEHERQQLLPPRRIRFALGALERQQDAAANLERILERLEARARSAPTRRGRSRCGSSRSRRSGSRSRASPPSVSRRAGSSTSIAAASPSSTRTFARAPEDPADRRGDVAGRQRRRRHLIQQRLKQMMVVAIEQRDAHRHGRAAPWRPQSPPNPPPMMTHGSGLRIGSHSGRSDRSTCSRLEQTR